MAILHTKSFTSEYCSHSVGCGLDLIVSLVGSFCGRSIRGSRGIRGFDVTVANVCVAFLGVVESHVYIMCPWIVVGAEEGIVDVELLFCGADQEARYFLAQWAGG
jgi:hypothetical protein